MYRLSAGYSFNDYLSIELGYLKLTTSDGRIDNLPFRFSADAFDVSVIGRYPVLDNLGFFARIGWAVYESDLEITGATLADDDDDLIWGLGAWYRLGGNHGVRLEYSEVGLDRLNLNGDVRAVSVSYIVRFGR